MSRLQHFLFCCCSIIVFLLMPLIGRADDFPQKPNPPKLVNDFAHCMSADEVATLEAKLNAFSDSTSNQVTIVTIKSIGEYDVAQYATELGNRWGIGKRQKNNGVIILAAIDDHRINISVGKGLEGALPDITAGQIINREIKPRFRENNYYQGFDAAADAIKAATRGEYKGDPRSGQKGLPIGNVVVVIIIVLVVMFLMSRGGGSGGGRYMSGRGYGGFGGGFLGGTMFGSGMGSGWSGGGSDSGGGGFGGFGGGSFGGGGASGSW